MRKLFNEEMFTLNHAIVFLTAGAALGMSFFGFSILHAQRKARENNPLVIVCTKESINGVSRCHLYHENGPTIEVKIEEEK